MNKDLIIPRRHLDTLRSWLARLCGAAGWLLSLGLLGAGAALAGVGALGWLLGGGAAMLALALLGGAVLGGLGTALLAQRLEGVARQLRPAPAAETNPTRQPA